MSGNGKHEAFFDTSGLQELLFEDVRDLSVHNGLLRFTTYTFRRVPGFKGPVWVPVQPMITPVDCLGQIRDHIDAVLKHRSDKPNAVAPKVSCLVH